MMTYHLDEVLATLTSEGPDSGRRGGVSVKRAVVLVCSDVARGKVRAALVEKLEELVERDFDGEVRVVKNLCSTLSELSATLKDTGAQRVIVACRYASLVRDEVKLVTRRLGVHPAGVVVLDLASGPRVTTRAFVEHSTIQIHAALTAVFSADLSSAFSEGRSSSAKRYSRRNLFHPGEVARPLSATWSSDLCQCSGRRRACVDACQFGALTLVGSRIVVNRDRCTGCGACLGTCPSAALSISGVTVSTFEEVVKVLAVASLKHDPRPGIAITCENAATRATVGGEWLTLDVSSLEMASLGWPLQLLASGISVRLSGCSQARCGSRAHEVIGLCRYLIERSASNLIIEPQSDAEPEPLCAELRIASASHLAPRGADAIGLREPDATISALSFLSEHGEVGVAPVELASPAASPAGAALDALLSVESVFSPMGQVNVEGDMCSACGSCAVACPTGALSIGADDDAAFTLTLDLVACTACGACVPSCPERAISLQRVIASSSFKSARKVVARVETNGHCTVCGARLVDGLAPSVIASLLSDSHAQLAARLLQSRTCVDCQLLS